MGLKLIKYMVGVVITVMDVRSTEGQVRQRMVIIERFCQMKGLNFGSK